LLWRLQHNVLYHTYTNVQGADEDIDGPLVLRFSPNQEHKFIHRFQHLHAWLFYPLMSLVKVIYTDLLSTSVLCFLFSVSCFLLK
jgi:linoleoyl-CoA desaturase